MCRRPQRVGFAPSTGGPSRLVAGGNGRRRHPCVTCCTHRHRISTIREEIAMQAIVVRDRDAGLAGLSLADCRTRTPPRTTSSSACMPLGSPRGAGLAGDLVGSCGPGPDAERSRARGVRRRRRAGLRDHRPDRRPAGVRPDRLGAQRDAGGVRRDGGAQPRAAAGGRRPCRRRWCVISGLTAWQGPVRPRPPPRRADRADPRRRGQRRLDRRAARPSGRLPGDRHRPGRRQRPCARSWRRRVRGFGDRSSRPSARSM